MLPVLVKLLQEPEPTVREEAPWVFTALIQDSAELQQLAADADGVHQLVPALSDEKCSLRLREGTLRALGTLCMPSDRDDVRKQLVEAKVLPAIVKGLGARSPANIYQPSGGAEAGICLG